MSADAHFIEFAKDLFAGLGPIRSRRMFGGVGFYAGELFFAIGDDEVIYLKADDVTEAQFAGAGSERFRYAMKDGEQMSLRYWRLPDSALDDPDEAAKWGRLAMDAARRAAAAKPKPRKKPKKA